MLLFCGFLLLHSSSLSPTLALARKLIVVVCFVFFRLKKEGISIRSTDEEEVREGKGKNGGGRRIYPQVAKGEAEIERKRGPAPKGTSLNIGWSVIRFSVKLKLCLKPLTSSYFP